MPLTVASMLISGFCRIVLFVFGHDVFAWDAGDYTLQARRNQALSSTGGPRALLLMAIGLVHLFEALEFWRA